MKLHALTIVVLLFFTSCSTNDQSSEEAVELKSDAFPQKWELVAMSGMVAGVPATTGDDMEWQEHYLLFADSTFVKSRERDNEILEDTGTYLKVTTDEGGYIELTYETESELLGNCSHEPKEVLAIESETRLVGTWWACDGPGLFYQRME